MDHKALGNNRLPNLNKTLGSYMNTCRSHIKFYYFGLCKILYFKSYKKFILFI